MNSDIITMVNKLRRLYWVEEKSTREIGEIYETSKSTIICWMDKFGIPRRTLSEARQLAGNKTMCHNIPTMEEQRILDGLVLSDGCLSKRYKNGNARYQHIGSEFGFLGHIMEVLPSLPWGSTEPRQKVEPGSKSGFSYQIWSRVNSWLTKQQGRWYPNGTKIIPMDLSISPEMLLYAYLGDGTLGQQSHQGKNDKIYKQTSRPCFSFHAFSNDDVERLRNAIQCEFNVDSDIYQIGEKKQPVLTIKAHSVKQFFDVIGHESPVECYDYKFDWYMTRHARLRAQILGKRRKKRSQSF